MHRFPLPPPDPHRILLIDNQPIFRLGLRSVLQATADLRVSHEAACPQTALEALGGSTPGLAILELSLSTVSAGLRLAGDMLLQQPDLRVLILSLHQSPGYAADAFRLGARGYACKSESADALLEATRTVLGGGLYVSPVFRDRPIFQTLADPANPITLALRRLTGREFQIFRLLGSGDTMADIARKLEVSIKTIETHRAHIAEKLGLQGSADTVQFAADWVSFHAP